MFRYTRTVTLLQEKLCLSCKTSCVLRRRGFRSQQCQARLSSQLDRLRLSSRSMQVARAGADCGGSRATFVTVLSLSSGCTKLPQPVNV